MLDPGDVVYLPGGMLHAVKTPVESVVFGSNLIFRSNLEAVFHQYKREREAGIPHMECFPDLEILMLLVRNDDFKGGRQDPILETLVKYMYAEGKILQPLTTWLTQNVSHFV